MEYQAYKELIKTLPKPTISQIDNFIDYVARDHSWYKHLTQEREEPFVFYFDPNAGKRLISVDETSKENKDHIFHFDNNPPFVYQRNYGFWQYYATKYTVNYIPNNDGSVRDSRPYIGLNIVDENGILTKLPPYVIERSTFMMSSYLHKSVFEWVGPAFELHTELINELRDHLISISDMIYDT